MHPLLPARLAFGPGGVPYSEAYGDVYHSADGGLAQSRHVFLGGNGLPERWDWEREDCSGRRWVRLVCLTYYVWRNTLSR